MKQYSKTFYGRRPFGASGASSRSSKPAATFSPEAQRLLEKPKVYERVFASARSMTGEERRRFALWCRQQGIACLVGEMAKRIWISTMKH